MRDPNTRAFGFDAIAHMNAARDRMAATGGRTYKRPSIRRERKSEVEWWQPGLARWQHVRADAIEQFRFDVHGEQWEGF